MKHTIEKLDIGKFKISWDNILDSTILLDFNPVINEFNLHGTTGVLEHWQAKPLNLRRWGLYCISSDQYYSVKFNEYSITQNSLNVRSLQVPDNKYPNIRPTAFKLYENKKIFEYPDGRLLLI